MNFVVYQLNRQICTSLFKLQITCLNWTFQTFFFQADHFEENVPAIGARTSDCRFVELNCKPKRTCGQLPLYSSMGKETPTFGEGSTPWTAGIYIEGETLLQPVVSLKGTKLL